MIGLETFCLRVYGILYDMMTFSSKDLVIDQKNPPKVQLVVEAKLAAWQVEKH